LRVALIFSPMMIMVCLSDAAAGAESLGIPPRVLQGIARCEEGIFPGAG
jgi:hypothetical protein